MNNFPITVRGEAPAYRAHIMFLQFGLRHLTVVDKFNDVIGMITRKDLDLGWSLELKFIRSVCIWVLSIRVRYISNFHGWHDDPIGLWVREDSPP